ncbi:MAG: hypothetical protein NT015_11445 [Alphaproteobacteria bacterium]|nr:hypothetical protein [Alphaproteobacteria bacterium]
MSADRQTLSRAFAAFAAKGWTEATLRAFCNQQSISDEQRRAWWPNGVRSVAWDLNAAADEEMERRWPEGAPSLVAIFEQRFKSNESLRASVGQLARSDLFHPFNTISRTAETARRMLALCKFRPNFWRVSRLVIAYSATVLVWIGDRSEGGARTKRAGGAFLVFLGLR